jgi:NAD(P)-dependent dehydrogenase (short-subunit alcohol dehydrogenase family)
MNVEQNRIGRRAMLGGAVALGAAGFAGIGAAAASGAPAAGSTGPVDTRGETGKAVLITGTSSGFGRLTALALARAGQRVFASMRDSRSTNAAAARDLRGIADKERLALEVLDIDIRDEASVERGVRRVRERAGRIDVLINNAGTFYPALLETLTMGDIQEVFNTGVLGHLRMNRAVLPVMRGQRDGLIVQVTTALGRVVLPFAGAYSGAKWAIEALTEATRYEVSQLGVDVVIVEPGPYNTDFVDPNAVSYYRRYLRRLSSGDAERRDEYGELAKRVESHLVEEPEGNDPQEVVDTLVKLVQTPRGRRPLRTFGPGLPEHWAELNTAAARVQTELLEFNGMQDLAAVKPTSR